MPDVAQLAVTITADTAPLEAGLARAQQSVSGFGSAISGAVTGVAVAGVAALGAAFVTSAKSAMDFEKELSAIQAVSGATGEQLGAIRETALQLGKDTSFSAQEAAAGMEELIKAGVSLQDALAGGARAALDLAAASGTAVPEAASVMSNAMNAFALSGDQATHVADALTQASNASATSVHELGYSFAATAAVAHTVGLSFDDTTVALAELAQAGLKGSDAGTSLKTMLISLNPSSKTAIAAMKKLGIITADGANQFFDAAGNAKSLADIQEVLRTSTANLTKEQKLNLLQQAFGTDALRAAAILSEQGAEGYQHMAQAMKDSGPAQDAANTRLDNLAGSLEKLKGSLETAAIMLGSMLTPVLKSWTDSLTDVVNRGIEILQKLPAAWADVQAKLAGQATTGSLEAALQQLGVSDAVIGPALDWLQRLGDAWRTFQQVMAGDWSPSDVIDPFVNEVGTLTVAFRDDLLPAITAVGAFLADTLWPAIKDGTALLAEHQGVVLGVVAAWATFQTLSAVAAGITALTAAWGALTGAIAASGGIISAIVAVLGGPLTLIIAAVALAVGLLVAAWVEDWGGIQEITFAAIAALSDGFTAFMAFLATTWEQITTAATAAWTAITDAITNAWAAIQAAFAAGIAAVQSAWQAGWDLLASIQTAAWSILTQENQQRIAELIALTTTLWTTLGQLWTAGTTALTTLMATWWALLVAAWTQYTAQLVTLLTTWWQTLQQLWTTGQEQVTALVQPFWDGIAAIWQTMLTTIGDALGAAWAQIVTATSGLFTKLQSAFQSAVSTLGTAASNLGSAIMDALVGAINAKVQSVVESVTGAVKSALDAARGLLGGAGGGGNASWAQIAREEGVDPALFQSLIQQESGGNQSARSGAGAIGLTQLMPGTAASLGVDPYDELQNVRGGARYLKQLLDLYGGDTTRALIAYNAGPGGGAPAESVAYANRVIAGAGQFQVPAGVITAQRGMTPQIGQFSLQGGTLTAAEAAAFCGPAAAMWFSSIYGRMPTKDEAEAMARQIGWTPEWGMTGPGSEQRLLSMMGVASNVNYRPTSDDVASLAAQNVPFLLSTAGHFFQVQGGSLAGLNVGASGTALQGGSAVMSLDQITALTGAMNGIITLAPQMGDALVGAGSQGGTAFTTLAAAAVAGGQQLVTAATDAMGTVTTIYGDASGNMTAIVTNAAGQVTATFTGMNTAVVTDSTTMAAGVATSIGTMATGTTEQVAAMSAGVLTSVTDLGGATLTITQDMAGNTIATITDLAGNVTAQYTQLAADTTAAAATMDAGVVEATTAMAADATEQVTTMSEDVLTSVTDLGDGVLTITQDLAGNYTATITDLAGNVTSQYQSMAQDVVGTNEEMAQTVVETLAEATDDIGSAVEDWGSSISDELSNIADDAQDAAQDIGQAITDGIASGIEDGSGDVSDAVRDVVKEAIDDAKDEAESDSPSRLFARELGLPIAQGVAQGIMDGYGDVADASRGLVDVPAVPTAGGAGAGGGTQTFVVQVAIGDRIAEELYITGRALAIQRGRAPDAGAVSRGPLT